MRRVAKLLIVTLAPLAAIVIAVTSIGLLSVRQPPSTIRTVKQSPLHIRNDWRCIRTTARHEVVGFVENRSTEPVEGVLLSVDLYKRNGIYWRSGSRYLGTFNPSETKTFHVRQFVPPGIEIGQCEIKLFNRDSVLLTE